MSEIKENNRRLIDPLALFLALVGGPLLVTLATFWLYLIPFAAALIGGPLYILAGTPVLLWALSRRPASPGLVALLAFGTNLALCLIWIAVASVANPAMIHTALSFAAFGTVFAPLWGAVTGYLYRRLCRDFYNRINNNQREIPCSPKF